MTLQQLRYFCEVVHQGCNVSRAAVALLTSQPGLSKQLQLLEREIGAPLFVRRHKRLLGLTDVGHAVLDYARTALAAVESIRQIGSEVASPRAGQLTVGTTHTHARYALSKPIARFIKAYPTVQLSLRHGDPIQIATWVTTGEADLGISAEPLTSFRELLLLPCYEQKRIGLAKRGHPFLREKRLSMETIAKYPMITYDLAFTGRAQIAAAFAERKLVPQVVLNATDSDVMKEYVKQGLGIAIVAENVYVPEEDRGLRCIDVSPLFPPHTVYVLLHRAAYLRHYAYGFIELVAPSLKRPRIENALAQMGRLPHKV
jgi:LysR family transcriptional regulator, cys regulon transcriptional activator